MNKYNPNIHHRRSIRLKGYDYAQAGLYFITICVQNREYLFGEIIEQPQGNAPTMQLNDAGKMVETEWLKIKNRFPNIELHEFVVMPNHFHAILEIISKTENVGVSLVDTPNDGGNVIGNDGQTVAPNDGGNVIGNDGQTVAPNDGGNVIINDNDNIIPIDDTTQMDVTTRKGQPQGIAPTDNKRDKTVGDMVGAFQSIVTVEYIRGVKNLGWPPFNGKLWQRNYWEHIIRNEQSYHRISEYIVNNPAKWHDDKFNKI